ncbi:MAG: hypothetical protein MUE94_00675 [Verrucomicrobia bacterium]|jgi:hypothetical protein|nr:hypothetical protein [Verrucomicrobiota bacterium]
MKTKHLLFLAAAAATATFATSAQAGVSFQVSVGWPAPVYVEPVYAPVCPPPVMVVAPPRPVCGWPVVLYGQPYRPACAPVRIHGGRGWRHDVHPYQHGRSHHGHGRSGCGDR